MTTEGTPTGETSTAGQVSNDAPTVSSTVTPTPAASPTVDIEEIKRQAQQAEMRANQLANQLAAKEKADAEARQKQLEEQNQWKELYEKANSDKLALEQAQEAAAKQATVERVKGELTSAYSPEVLDVANTAGLTLTDDSETAQADFKSRLDLIAEKFAPAPKKVVGNNIPPVTPSVDADRAKLISRMRFSDSNVAGAARTELINKLPALDKMREAAGLRPTE